VQLNPIPIGKGTDSGFNGGEVWNNCFYNFTLATSMNFQGDTRGPTSIAAINNNNYFGLKEWMNGQGPWPKLFYNPAGVLPIYGSGIAIYRQADGYESNSSTNQPLINLTTYAPLTNDAVLVGRGKNLTAFAIANNIPQLTNDFYGNPRPATGPWTIGAFEQASSTPVVALTVNNGSGSGYYNSNSIVSIVANTVSGKTFAFWSGNTSYVNNTNAASTTVTGATNLTLTANYTTSSILSPPSLLRTSPVTGP